MILRKLRTRNIIAIVLVTVIAGASVLLLRPDRADSISKRQSVWEPELSTMGKIARGDLPIPEVPVINGAFPTSTQPEYTFSLQGDDRLVHSPTAPDFQSETSVAVNGSNVVVGYNDIRGFSLPTVSVSGYSYSSDGGATWTDGGQLPTLGGDAVYGDPDVKTWTDPNTNDVYFFYASIYANTLGQASLSVHVSTDGGATWSNPREVATATSATDFADKEFMDVDPETGRLIVSWTNFGASTTMRVTYSDDFGLNWVGPTVFVSSGQGSIPRADGGSDNVHLVWRTSSNIMYTRSTDNGATWSAPVSIAGGLSDTMNPYGSDRIHGFPSMDVNDTTGNVYVVFSQRGVFGTDFSDIYFLKGTSFGTSWAGPTMINAHVGDNRSQFFPSVAVDQSLGYVNVVFYDQSLGTGTSDSTDVFHVHSDNISDGASWSNPMPLSDRTFHAEAGNTTSQPNMGDYIQCVADGGLLYTAFAKTGLPTWLTYSPDTYVDISDIGSDNDVPVAFDGIAFADTGCATNNGWWEPCETITLTTRIRRYDPNTSSDLNGLTGTLSTAHPGVTITNPVQSFSNMPMSGATTSTNTTAFNVVLDPNLVVCGETIEFDLRIDAGATYTVLHFSHAIGRLVSTPLLSEAFDGVTAPALPAGWVSANLAGSSNAWVTSTTFSASASNSAYCADISSTSLNELSSPGIIVPADCDLLEVTFDVTHNIELDAERRAWDGALLRVLIGGKKYLAGAIASEFSPFYPWQMNRQASADQPLQDLSCWSSNVTPNFNSVTLRIPDVGGQTVNLLFDMSTDAFAGTATGMFVDNVNVSSLKYTCECTDPPVLAAAPTPVIFASVPYNTTACETLYVTNNGATPLVVSDVTGCGSSPFSLDFTLWPALAPIAKGETAKFLVCVTPTGPAADSCTVSITSNGGNQDIKVYLDVVTAASNTPSYGAAEVVPNPFNPEATIRFSLPERMPVTIDVWSVTGARVATLASDRVFAAGSNQVRWSGLDDRGARVASGVYFVRVKTRLGERKTRAVLLK